MQRTSSFKFFIFGGGTIRVICNPYYNYAIVEGVLLDDKVKVELPDKTEEFVTSTRYYTRGSLSNPVKLMVVEGAEYNMDYVYDVARIMGVLYNKNHKKVLKDFRVYRSDNGLLGLGYGKYFGVVTPIGSGRWYDEL